MDKLYVVKNSAYIMYVENERYLLQDGVWYYMDGQWWKKSDKQSELWAEYNFQSA